MSCSRQRVSKNRKPDTAVIRYDDNKQTLTLAVRDLLQSDDSGPGVYLPGRAQLGTVLHQNWQQRRRKQNPDYQSELSLKCNLIVEGVTITLQGRLDGLQLEPQPVVEELKSTLLPLESISNLSPATHPDWFEQLEYYSWLVCRELKLDSVTGHLIVLPTQGEGYRLQEHLIDLEKIEQRLLRQLQRIVKYHRLLTERLRRRRKQQVHFPFERIRKQQDLLINAVEEATSGRYHLVAQAPTGIGKTVATLIPALQQALLTDKRIFVITPKNSGQQSFLELVRLINNNEATHGSQPVSCVRMPAREKICPAERYICDKDYCPFLQDFQATLKRATAYLQQTAVVGEQELLVAAEQFRICPHELALSLSELRDVVIGDYNHVFSPSSQIRRLFRTGKEEDFLLLVDEAHHFPARARSWFSMDLSLNELDNVIHLCSEREKRESYRPTLFGSVSPTAMLRQCFQRFRDTFSEQDNFRTDRWSWQHSNSATFKSDEWEELTLELAQAFMAWLLHHKLRGNLLEKDAVANMYYDLQYFIYLTRFQGDNFEQFVQRQSNDTILRILCLAVPQSVRDQLAEFPSAIFFSATLPPATAFLELAGLSAETPVLRLPSIFPPENRKVVIHTGIGTRLRQRTGSMPLLAELITTTFRKSLVNMAVFFPSFAYLEQLRLLLPPDLPLLLQKRTQDNSQRAALLTSLAHEIPCLLLAVSGGSFAEGIDLPGKLLQIVVVVGPSLPAISVDNELMQAYYNSREEDGFAFAYRIPGINNVAQSSGRLIRSETDRGLLILAGQRFTLKEYHRLLPEDITAVAVTCSDTDEFERLLKRVEF
jgi:DNA excision repair protein ERCC-2